MPNPIQPQNAGPLLAYVLTMLQDHPELLGTQHSLQEGDLRLAFTRLFNEVRSQHRGPGPLMAGLAHQLHARLAERGLPQPDVDHITVALARAWFDLLGHAPGQPLEKPTNTSN